MSVVQLFPSAVLEGEELEEAVDMIGALTGMLERGELAAVAVCAVVTGDQVYSGAAGIQNDPYRLVGLLRNLTSKIDNALIEAEL